MGLLIQTTRKGIYMSRSGEQDGDAKVTAGILRLADFLRIKKQSQSPKSIRSVAIERYKSQIAAIRVRSQSIIDSDLAIESYPDLQVDDDQFEDQLDTDTNPNFEESESVELASDLEGSDVDPDLDSGE